MNDANKITTFRLICVPLFLVLIYIGASIPAAILFILACISDMLDGYIARKNNQISNFGKFSDPLADKILTISAMCYLVDVNRMPGWILAIICIREFTVTGLRLIAVQKGTVISADVLGKIKTITSMISISTMLIFNNKTLDIIFCILIMITTLISGINYLWKNKGVLKDDNI